MAIIFGQGGQEAKMPLYYHYSDNKAFLCIICHKCRLQAMRAGFRARFMRAAAARHSMASALYF